MARHPKDQRTLTHDQVWTALDRLAGARDVGFRTGEKKSPGPRFPTTSPNQTRPLTARERWTSNANRRGQALAATTSSIDCFVP